MNLFTNPEIDDAISFEPTKMIVEERLIQNYCDILNIALKLHSDYDRMAKESR